MREERRFVTALFADLVGSTALGERLEPEELKLVVGDAVGRIVGAVEAFGGTVKDLAGDGVLALFGAPVAHEDDPERALLAGLRIVEEIGEFADEVRRSWGIDGFAVRVGVESGPVVVGAIGAGSRVEYGAMGDAVNIAARLQADAEPGTVLVGEETAASGRADLRVGTVPTSRAEGEVRLGRRETGGRSVGVTRFDARDRGRAGAGRRARARAGARHASWPTPHSPAPGRSCS